MIPTQLRAGDSATWFDDSILSMVDGSVYGPADGYTLTWELRGPSKATITASTVNGTWSSTLTTTVSAGLSAGDYSWAAVLTKIGERITAQSGLLTLLPNLVTADAGYEPRSTARIALDAARAALADFTANHRKVHSYTINNRSMTFESPTEILQVIQYWERRVMVEGETNAMQSGLGNPRRLHVRFT